MESAIWCAHLKDNRNRETYPDKTAEKAEYCLARCIIAIGWAEGEDGADWETFRRNAEDHYADFPNSLSGFRAAANALERMNPGDLVWVIVPDSHRRYLYQVTEPGQPKADQTLKDIDIGAYRQCRQIACCTVESQPEPLKTYPARRTLFQIQKPDCVQAVKKLYEDCCGKEPEKED